MIGEGYLTCRRAELLLVAVGEPGEALAAPHLFFSAGDAGLLEMSEHLDGGGEPKGDLFLFEVLPFQGGRSHGLPRRERGVAEAVAGEGAYLAEVGSSKGAEGEEASWT